MQNQRGKAGGYSLRPRGLGLTLLVVLVLVEVFTVAAVVVSQQIKTNEALDIHTRQLLHDVVDETQENARGFLTQAENTVRLGQRLFATGLLSLERPDQLSQFFFEQLGIVKHIDALFFGTPDGEFVFVKHASERAGGDYVTKIIEREGDERRVYRVWRDASFAEVSTEDDPQDEYDPRRRPWYIGAAESADVFWTDPYIFFTSQQAGLTVAVAVKGDDGELLGVVGADVELSALSEFLGQQQVASIGSAVIVHRSADVVAYPDPAQLPRTTQSEKLRLAKLDELDEVTSAAARELFATHPDIADLDEPFFGRFRVAGESYRMAFVPFLDQKRWPWFMGVYAPEERFAGSIRKGQRQSLALAVMISVLITGLAFLLGPKFMRPLQDLEERAVQDPLTGVLNRRSFMEHSESLLRDAQRQGRALSVIMVDVDHFKRVNDTYGHVVGDDALQAVAARIGRGLSYTDLLARYGGEEFAVVLPDTSLSQATTVAERLKKLIENTRVDTRGGPVQLTISLGVAELDPARASIPTLMETADQCLLRAKREGRNRVVVSGMPDATGV